MLPNSASRILRKNKRFGKELLKIRNYYGYSYGWNGVNEGNPFFNKVFKSNLDNKVKRSFAKLYSNVDPQNNEVFIFKNISHYKDIGRLKSNFPQLKIVRLTRDPLQVAESILKAYYDLKYFNPIPAQLSHFDFSENPQEFAVKQLLEIETEIDQICTKIDPKDIFNTNYDSFCNDPATTFKNMLHHFGLNQISIIENSIMLKSSTAPKVSKEDVAKLKLYLAGIGGY